MIEFVVYHLFTICLKLLISQLLDMQVLKTF